MNVLVVCVANSGRSVMAGIDASEQVREIRGEIGRRVEELV